MIFYGQLPTDGVCVWGWTESLHTPCGSAINWVSVMGRGRWQSLHTHTHTPETPHADWEKLNWHYNQGFSFAKAKYTIDMYKHKSVKLAGSCLWDISFHFLIANVHISAKFSVAQRVFQGHEFHSVDCIAWIRCMSLWIKASTKGTSADATEMYKCIS